MTHSRPRDPIRSINEHHADDLLLAARVLGGFPDATAARAERVDHNGIDVLLDTPNGQTAIRLDFATPVPEGRYPFEVRAAFRDLTRRARSTRASTASDPGGRPKCDDTG